MTPVLGNQPTSTIVHSGAGLRNRSPLSIITPMQHRKSLPGVSCAFLLSFAIALVALLVLAVTAAEPLSRRSEPDVPTLAVTNEAGNAVQLFSREAFRAEFSFLRRECHQFDLKGQPIRTDGWTDNIPDVEWPFMQFAYFGFACVNLARLDAEKRAETLAEIRWLLEAMQTPRLSGFMTPSFGEPFGKDEIHPSCFVHGLFLTLALRYREVSGDRRYDEIIHKVAVALSSAYAKSDQAILGSYRTMWWLTDNFPALAGLAQYHGKTELLRLAAPNPWSNR